MESKEGSMGALVQYQQNSLLDKIISILRECKEPLCGYDIYTQLDLDVKRIEVGQLLLTHPTIFESDSSHPPRWKLCNQRFDLVEKCVNYEKSRMIYVFLDVSNIPQAVPLLKKYEHLPYIRVYGFEDYFYNGKERLTRTIKARKDGRNYADMLLSHKFILRYTKNKGEGMYILCSKDNYFESFPKHYMNVHLVTHVSDLERLLVV